jgi:hypothetical protein
MAIWEIAAMLKSQSKYTFCLVVAQSHSQRTVSDKLQRSTAIISIYANRVCKTLYKLGKMIIQPRSTEIPHPYIAHICDFTRGLR